MFSEIVKLIKRLILSIERDNYLISPPIKQLPLIHKKINLAILASGKGSNFNAIINTIKSGELNAEIKILIVNKPDCGAIEIARANNIEYKIIDHNEFTTREEHESAILNALGGISVDLVIMAGWMRVVTPLLINSFADRIINIHPSLLPSFKGVNAIVRSLESGSKITGCTVHLVSQEVDSGQIIIQAAVPIFKEDDYLSLRSRIQRSEHIILPAAIALIASKLN